MKRTLDAAGYQAAFARFLAFGLLQVGYLAGQAALVKFAVEPVEKVPECLFRHLRVVLRYHLNHVGFEKSIVTYFSRSLFRGL
jgi:hypothetical protein